jgi:hypothetical protein
MKADIRASPEEFAVSMVLFFSRERVDPGGVHLLMEHWMSTLNPWDIVVSPVHFIMTGVRGVRSDVSKIDASEVRD